jgi:hypothetical protein
MAVSTIDPNGLNIGQIGGTRNKIINGAMTIDQRNAGAAVSANGAYPTDRWQLGISGGTWSVQQSSTAPAGFSKSTAITISTGYSKSVSDQNNFRQFVEGSNTYDLGWGASGAQSVTLSFWVRSSLTGTFAGSLMNSAFDRSYVFTYSISAADTWEYKTVSIEGDTSGTWLTTNGVGVRVFFDLGSGSNSETTAGAWTAGEYRRVSGAVDVVATTGATFYLTGVQLEAGDTATPFEHRSYGQELALCQRYYERLRQGLAGRVESSTGIGGAMAFPVEMRAGPTQTLLDGTSAWWVPGIGQYTITGTLDYNSSPIGFHIAAQVSGSPTTGNMAFLTLRTNDIYAFSAEL